MKINISRQYIYLIVVSFVLFTFVLFFSFGVLIPAGKEYRIKRVELIKTSKDLREFEDFHNETLESLKNLQSKNRRIITAFDTKFDAPRFEKQNKNFFSALSIEPKANEKVENEFMTYEVNTTSEINSPSSFYNFLESVNKSDWIIGINFPIHFKRDGELIKSSFTMKVYANNKETNTTASSSEAK